MLMWIKKNCRAVLCQGKKVWKHCLRLTEYLNVFAFLCVSCIILASANEVEWEDIFENFVKKPAVHTSEASRFLSVCFASPISVKLTKRNFEVNDKFHSTFPWNLTTVWKKNILSLVFDSGSDTMCLYHCIFVALTTSKKFKSSIWKDQKNKWKKAWIKKNPKF